MSLKKVSEKHADLRSSGPFLFFIFENQLISKWSFTISKKFLVQKYSKF